MTQTPSSSPGAPGSPGAPAGAPTSSIVDQTQDALAQVVEQTQSAAGQVSQQAQQQATSQLESQKARAVDSLVTVAQALRQTGQHLHQQDQRAVGGYVEQAAERVETLTNYLRARDVPQLVAETQEFARRQPGLFLSGAVALGFIGARFLMSSGQRAAGRQFASPNPAYTPSYAQAGALDTSGGTAYAGSMTAMPGVSGSATRSGVMPATSGSATAEMPDLTGTDRPHSVPGALEA